MVKLFENDELLVSTNHVELDTDKLIRQKSISLALTVSPFNLKVTGPHGTLSLSESPPFLSGLLHRKCHKI